MPEQSKAIHNKNENDSLIPVVGIGASAGGLSTLIDFLKVMPSDSGMAFVVILHLDPTHESMIVDLLPPYTQMNVVLAKDTLPVKADHVYLIPPNESLSITDGALYLSEPLENRGMRMPIDFFLYSLAEDQKEKSICMILSGTGTDGTLGLRAVKNHGGLAIVQSPDEASYNGMPLSAIASGIVDYILPVKDIPNAIVGYIQHNYIREYAVADILEGTDLEISNKIIDRIYESIGQNFAHYKKNTLIRRINRRMAIKKIANMEQYLRYIRQHDTEVNELFKDLLINVTSFFREEKVWQMVDETIIEGLLKTQDPNKSIRVWVPGCSTGEEAYTIAMLLREHIEKNDLDIEFNIFATDIDINALNIARNGRYTESSSGDIPKHLLDKYFVHDDGYYTVSRKLRENIVFSAQNILSDPPFTRMNLISCRNLLIYLDGTVQKKVIELFHFSLEPNGYLVLGNSETIGPHTDLFAAVSKKFRIYQRLARSMASRTNFPILPDKKAWVRLYSPTERGATPVLEKPGEITRNALLQQFAPTSILINQSHEIIYHFGETSKYLRFIEGEQTNNVFALVREGLMTRMRNAVHTAIRDEKAVMMTNARVKRDGKFFLLQFAVTPISNLVDDCDGYYLISFEDEEKPCDALPNADAGLDEDTAVRQLVSELNTTKEELQNTIEELETSNEELKASNEEVMSMNEELQSSNEELETSKVELQSLNEELTMVNSELKHRISAVEQARNDVMNLVNGTNIAAIFLDKHLSVTFYTPSSKLLYNIIPTDVGRPIAHVTTRFDDPQLIIMATRVLDTLETHKQIIQNENGEWFQRKIFPYRTDDNFIEGVVITFENITDFMTLE